MLARLTGAEPVRASPIPIVLITGTDPVRLGLVASMNRPGGNMTGVFTLLSELSGKRLGLLHDLGPKAATIAALFDPVITESTRIRLRDARDATAALRQKLLVREARTADEIDAQFASLNGSGGRNARRPKPAFSHSGKADCGARGTPSHPRDLPTARVCRSGRPHELWI
jgi:hypothetical protein